MNKSDAPSKTKQNDLFALRIDKMARAHLEYILFKMTLTRITEYKFNDPNVKVPLELFVKVFALKSLLKEPQALYESGFFQTGSQTLLDDAYAKTLV